MLFAWKSPDFIRGEVRQQTLDLIKTTSTACYLWDGSIYLFPGRKSDGRQKCPLCLVKISSVWSVNANTKPLGRAGEGSVSHYGMGLGSLLPLYWPMTMAGFQGCAGSQSSEAVSTLIKSQIAVGKKMFCYHMLKYIFHLWKWSIKYMSKNTCF